MKYIDIHSHLNLSPLKDNLEEVVSRMRDHKVGVIVVGVDYETSKLAVEIADRFPDVVLGATVGFHPTDANVSVALNGSEWAELKDLAQNKKVVAIGECGLDYASFTRERSEWLQKRASAEAFSEGGFNEYVQKTKECQKQLFKKQIELAIEVGKPLMIHARPSKGSMPARLNDVSRSGGDAYHDALDILEEYFKKYGDKLQMNFHFFVGNMDIAKKILDIGGTMSFDGPITFSRDYDEVIKFLPLESIMCETDAPFATPASHRGKICEPWMVIEVIKKIAEIKGLSVEIVEEAVCTNTKRVFGV